MLSKLCCLDKGCGNRNAFNTVDKVDDSIVL